jgi:predicted enzyme related to lactoylglutathione lyase
MSERTEYPPGVPCWVDTLQPDPAAARDFYGPLFGWEFAGSDPMPGDLPGVYFVARVDGRDVAGIGSRPDPGVPPVPSWNTYIRVDSADDVVARATAAGARLIAGPLDALPVGRRAVLVDPVGAAFGVWEAQARAGAQLINQPRTWAMSSLHAPEPDAAQAFYGAVFGWQPEPFGPPGSEMTLWRLPGYVGGEPDQPVPRDVVAVMAPPDDPDADVPPHWNVNFWVGDTDATVEQAARLGGKVVVPAMDTPGFRSAVLSDPRGAVFSISQLVAGPA